MVQIIKWLHHIVNNGVVLLHNVLEGHGGTVLGAAMSSAFTGLAYAAAATS